MKSEEHQVIFAFRPLQFVKVKAFDVNYNGRVQYCLHDGGDNKFKVEYVDDKGDFQSREFYADELEPK